ncbi:MAG TPA: sugar isomerase, partial [Rhodospirillaceae bacterium]|nr:sugar isomerase [Rhodospirillaceae bacterium]
MSDASNSHALSFFSAVAEIADKIDHALIDRLAGELAVLRENEGRLFILGVGGSAGNAGHA